MSCDCCLPFPRGSTFSDGVVTMADTTAGKLEGRVFTVNDTVHATGQPVKLRIVRNDTGSAITSARKFYKSDTGALEFGRRIGGVASTKGSPAWAMDDAYPVGTSIANDDLFYVIEQGPVYVTTETSSVNLSAHGGVVTDAQGYVDGAAPAAGEVVLGRIDQASTTTNSAVVVHIGVQIGGEGT